MRNKIPTVLLIIFAIFISQCYGQNDREGAEEEEEQGHSELRRGERCPAGNAPTQKCSKRTSCGQGHYCKLFRRDSSGDNIRFCCRSQSQRNGGRIANGNGQKYREKMTKAKQNKQKQKDKLKTLKRKRSEGHIDEEQYRQKKEKYKQKKDKAKSKARKNKQKLRTTPNENEW